MLRRALTVRKTGGALPRALCTGEPLSLASGVSPRPSAEAPHGRFGMEYELQGLCHEERQGSRSRGAEPVKYEAE